MKKLYITITILSLLLFVTHIQTSAKNVIKPITISGFIPDSCLKVLDNNEVEIFYYDKFDQSLRHEGQTIPVKLVDNRFSVVIQPKYEIGYFQIRDRRNPTLYLRSLEMDIYLINAGDKIFISFKTSKKADFTGKGAEKLNYQQFAGNLAYSSKGKIRQPKGSSVELQSYWRRIADEHIGLCLDSLSRVKNTMSENTFRVLSFNTTASVSLYHISHLTSVIVHNNFPPKDSLYIQVVKDEFMTMDLLQRGFATTNPSVIQYSSVYISYLREFLFKYNQLFSGNNKPLFANMYNKIITDYQGELRDKLLASSINTYYGAYYGVNGGSEFTEQALKIVTDAESRKLLEDLIKSKSPGAMAFDFDLEGIDSKHVKLKDLRGKVVVLEAWFNGCSGCMGLAKRMHPIIEQFKDNKGVVFISLSVDRDKNRFLDGVKNGKYGSPYSIYLYTNGKGAEHPMCLQYNWNAYPNMIFIDKEGKIISAKVIDPVNESKKQELIALLNKYINL